MKKIFLSAILSFGLLNLNAQLGLRVGGTLANITNNSSISTENVFGLNLGVVYNMGQKALTFKPGVIFTQKGYGVKFGGNTSTVNLNYIDIPLNLAYTINNKLQFEAGPYIGYALSGKVKSGSNSQDLTFSDNGLSRFDGGLNAGVAFYIKPQIQLGLTYNLGLLDIDNSSSGKITNNYLSLNLVYFLGSKN